ncbi:MAG: metal-sensing transcriptional repressor [Candidatus Izemoplasmatales bacterium]
MKCNKTLQNRMKRAKGQMNGVLTMMENETACMDILTQLKAIRANIDKTIGILTTENLIQRIEENLNIKLDDIDDALDLIIKGK